MPTVNDRPYIDVLSLTDADVYIYETIATLENMGYPATWHWIAEVTDMDEWRLRQRLRVLTQRGLLVQTESSGEPAFEPARRDWSTAPERAS